jgi:hypothetical protein
MENVKQNWSGEEEMIYLVRSVKTVIQKYDDEFHFEKAGREREREREI